MKDNVEDIIKAAMSAVDWKEFKGEFNAYKYVESQTFISPGATVNNYYGNGGSDRTDHKGLSDGEKEALVSSIEMCFSNTDGRTPEQWALLFVNVSDGMNNSKIYELVASWLSYRRIKGGYATWSRLGQPLAKYGIWKGTRNDENDMDNWNKSIRRTVK